jgi:hypothetical protein
VRDADGCSVDAPAACALLRDLAALRLPGLRVLRAGYSAVGGRAHLRPHCGMTNAQLKMHVGLVVPAREDGVTPCATLRVGNETRAWAAGRVLFFDDSFEHEVENTCDAERVVFQLVFAHPDLLLPQAAGGEAGGGAAAAAHGGDARAAAAGDAGSSARRAPVVGDPDVEAALRAGH